LKGQPSLGKITGRQSFHRNDESIRRLKFVCNGAPKFPYYRYVSIRYV